MGILAHISEFGFVLAAKGTSWGVLSRHVYLLLVGANAISLCLAPWLFHAWEWLQLSPTSPPTSPSRLSPPARKVARNKSHGLLPGLPPLTIGCEDTRQEDMVNCSATP